MFIVNADDMYGPITQIRQAGKATKKIPWSAFHLTSLDWERVRLCAEILAVSAGMNL